MVFPPNINSILRFQDWLADRIFQHRKPFLLGQVSFATGIAVIELHGELE